MNKILEKKKIPFCVSMFERKGNHYSAKAKLHLLHFPHKNANRFFTNSNLDVGGREDCKQQQYQRGLMPFNTLCLINAVFDWGENI